MASRLSETSASVLLIEAGLEYVSTCLSTSTQHSMFLQQCQYFRRRGAVVLLRHDPESALGLELYGHGSICARRQDLPIPSRKAFGRK